MNCRIVFSSRQKTAKAILAVCAIAATLSCFTVNAFQIQTDIGAIEIPNLKGYVRANDTIVEGIQKNKGMMGADGKVLFVLVREDEAKWQGNFTDMLSLSRFQMLLPVTDDEFEEICQSKGQFENGIKSAFPSATIRQFVKEGNLFFTSADIPLGQSASAGYLRLMNGGLRINGRMFSFLFMTTKPSKTKDALIEQFLRDIRDANNGGEKGSPNDSREPHNHGFQESDSQNAKITYSQVSSLLHEPKKRFRTLGLEKADGLDVQIDYPQSMEAKPGRQPHIVETFNIHLSPYSFSVQIMVTPVSGETEAAFALAAHITVKDAIDEFAESWASDSADEPGTQLLDYGSMKISDVNAFWHLSRHATERLGFKAEQLSKSFTIPAVKGKLLQLNFLLSVVVPDGESIAPISPTEFDTLNPLVMVILNSLTFMNKAQVIGGGASRPLLEGFGTGTAWFVSPIHVVTCWHVIEHGSDFFFTDFDGGEVPLVLVAKDEFTDLALLKVSSSTFFPQNWLPLATKTPEVSDFVCTVGFPHPDLLGQEAKFTEGTVTALSGIGDSEIYFQITTPMQKGNSGGPIVNECGEVVGLAAIKSMMLDEIADDKLQNVNFAVKVEKLQVLLHKAGIVLDPKRTLGTSMSKRDLFNKIRDAVILLQVK